MPKALSIFSNCHYKHHSLKAAVTHIDLYIITKLIVQAFITEYSYPIVMSIIKILIHGIVT